LTKAAGYFLNSVYPEIKGFQMELPAVSDQHSANPLVLKVFADR
jgi:hypothetical protein